VSRATRGLSLRPEATIVRFENARLQPGVQNVRLRSADGANEAIGVGLMQQDDRNGRSTTIERLAQSFFDDQRGRAEIWLYPMLDYAAASLLHDGTHAAAMHVREHFDWASQLANDAPSEPRDVLRVVQQAAIFADLRPSELAAWSAALVDVVEACASLALQMFEERFTQAAIQFGTQNPNVPLNTSGTTVGDEG
jgi:hypothetical protein